MIKIFENTEIIFYFVFFFMFCVGLLSDAKLMSSPKFRLILQLFLVSFFIYYFDIHVTPTRIDFVDLIFENNFLSILFSIFCFTILINGSNFIDGLNGLLLGYVILIIIILHNNGLIFFSELNNTNINFLIFSLVSLLIFNYLNYLFLGDSGSYILGLFIGYLLVIFYKNIS